MVKLMEHNKIAFEHILEELEKGNTVCYVAGTGTGKSYIAFALIEQVKGRVLYVYPKHSIKANITEYSEYEQFVGKVDFVTYNSLYKWSADDIANYDLVLFDECHHLKSKLFGSTATNLMNANSDMTMFVGLTATPQTYSGSVSDLFDKEVEGLFVSEAIAEKLMPPVDYNILCKEFDINLLKALTFEDVQDKIDIQESKRILQDIIFKRETSKWICFFKDIAELDMYKAELENLFEGFSIHTITSNTPNAMKRLKELSAIDKVVILTCTMLTEGVHLDGVDGVMIFRNCDSSSLFQQIIGRVCKVSKDAGNKPSPIVIDCSRCAYRLLYSIIKTNRKCQETSVSFNADCRKKASIVNVTVNGSVKLSDDDLNKIYDINNRYEIIYGGRTYTNLCDACEDIRVSYRDVKWFMNKFSLRAEQAISTVMSRNRALHLFEE